MSTPSTGAENVSRKRKKNAITRGRPLSQLQKEMIVQAYALCGNKAQVQREMGCSYQTVVNVIKAAETDRSLQAARKSALNDVAGKVHAKTEEILDSITEQDMESGLIKQYDPKDPDKLVAVKAYGPSLMQKVTSAAILTDKIKIIEETKIAMSADHAADPNRMPLPEDVQGSLRLLGQKIKGLRILDVQFADKHDDVAQKVQDVAHAASLHPDIEDADFEELDFDNPA